MANGDVVSQISDQYLQQFHRSIGVSGMQKLQSFPQLQELGYNGHLSHIKKDFHGLQDFKQQMDKYSSVSSTLRTAWALIRFLVPNNISISNLLFNSPGLGSVGKAFQSIHGFGQVFSLSPNDLLSPATVSSKASIYATQSTQASVVTKDTSSLAIGGASPTSSINVNQMNGILIVGIPTPTNNSLVFDGTNLVWQPAAGASSNTLAGDTDVSFASLLTGQLLSYNAGLGKWVNHTLVSADIPNLDTSKISTGILPVIRGGTGANLSTTGGASQVLKQASLGAAITVSQLSFSDISGLVSSTQLPNPSATTLGGIESIVAVAHKWINSISTSGVPTLSQPDYSDLTGTPVLPSNTITTAHQFFTAYNSATGAFTKAQPAAADLSDGVTGTSLVVLATSPTLTTPNIGAAVATSITGLTGAFTPNAAGGTDVGSAAKPFANMYIGLAATNNIKITGTATAARIFTLPDANSNPVQPSTASAHQFATAISSSGVITFTQPAFTDISGSIASTQLPNPSATTLGGIESFAAQASKWINTISTAGVPSATQPAFTDISGVAATGQIPNLAASIITSGLLALARGGTNADLSATGGTSQVLKQVSIGAAITVGQLAASDLSNGTNGTGAVVLVSSPSLTTPTIGVATATSINKVAITAPTTSATITIANAKTLTVNNTLAFSGTDGITHTFPATAPTSGVLAYGAPKFQQFTTGGTFTIPTGVTAVKITVVGAGGAGGGGSATVNGGGGGSGGVGIKWLSGLTPGNTLTVTVGTGGTGVSAAGGNVGTASSVASGTQTITTVTANGGGGGLFIGASSAGGAAGAVGSGGDINSGGTGGSIGTGFGGTGAPGIFGGGGQSAGGGVSGNPATGPGAGGSGAGSNSNQAGGAGSAGIVIFEWVA